jgi:hypothetical protein
MDGRYLKHVPYELKNKNCHYTNMLSVIGLNSASSIDICVHISSLIKSSNFGVLLQAGLSYRQNSGLGILRSDIISIHII